MATNTNLDPKTKKELEKQADEEVSKHSRIALLIGVAILAILIILDQVVSANIIIVFYIAAFIFGAYASLHLANSINDKITTFTLILIPRLILSILLYLFFNHVMLMVDVIISVIMFKAAQLISSARGIADAVIPEEQEKIETEKGE